jgi:tRNA-Thr(GGU) m(6)t(6)A37 methyltransferase TsaA
MPTTPADDPGMHPPVQLSPIGYVVSEFAEPQDAPPQATEAYDQRGQVILYERFAAGLDGLQGQRYVWLLTWLHAQPEEATTEMLVVPRSMEATGGRTGVYATRSPHRHNRLGLSLVRVVGVSGNVLDFYGVDLVNGTPVLDIKPWYAGTDTPP